MAAEAGREEVEREALTNGNVRRFIAEKPVKKVIIVPGKLVNIVV